MNVLIFSQVLFNLTSSIAIITIWVLFAMVAYHLMHITKRLHEISDNLGELSEETKEAIEEIIEKLSTLPILSFLMDKKGKSKGRKESKNKGRKDK